MPGPAPKPASQRRRTNAAPGTVRLPAAGRSGPAPKWPLGRAGRAQKLVWDDLWALPQAVAWERLHLVRVVARYTVCLVEAERPGASAALLAEVRQIEDRLGLSAMSMLRLRWEITEPDEAAPDGRDEATVTAIDEYRRMVGQ